MKMKKQRWLLPSIVATCVATICSIATVFAQDTQSVAQQQSDSTNSVLRPPINSSVGSFSVDSVTNPVVQTIDTTNKSIQISGRIVNEKNEPIVGVSISVKGTNLIATSGDGGGYKLFNIPTKGEKLVLVFSAIGYAEQDITAVPNNATINVALKPANKDLDEVVVIGYGSVKQSDLTGSVAVITSKNFNTGINTSPDQAVQGKIAGVQVLQPSGAPGAGLQIQIRGANNIRSGNAPLYVVDGVPITADNPDASGGVNNTGYTAGSPSGVRGSSNPMNFINPNDIERIDILKDASATAIYGARGANGVILITTKSAKTDGTTLNYLSTYGYATITKTLPVMNRQQFIDFNTKLYQPGGKLFGDTAYTNHPPDFITNPNNYLPDVNWQKQIFKTAWSTDQTIQYGYRGSKGFLFGSLNYNTQDGTVITSNYTKYTARLNGSIKVLNDKVTIGTHLTYYNQRERRAALGGREGNYPGKDDPLAAALGLAPITPVKNADGTYNQEMSIHNPAGSPGNPVAMLAYNDEQANISRFVGNVDFTVDVVKGLQAKLNVGVDQSGAQDLVNRSANLAIWSPAAAQNGEAEIWNKVSTSPLLEAYLTYNKKINAQHEFTIMGGYSYQQFYTRGDNMMGLQFSQHIVPYTSQMQSSSNDSRLVSSYENKAILQSFFGRFNYSLMDKYLFTATIRSDGSSRFGVNNQYATFPSFALAWNMKKESFMQQIRWLSAFKLRGSWGMTGNQAVPIGASLQLYNAGNWGYINGAWANGIASTQTGNPNLKWETTRQYDFGVNVGFVGDRIRLDVDYFDKTTSDLLFYNFTGGLAPTNQFWQNIPGSVSNKGIELTLNTVNIRTKKFEWDMSINATFINNNVSNLNVGAIQTGEVVGPGQNNAFAQRILNGQPLPAFYGLKFAGFDNKGNELFYSKSGGTDIATNLTDEDKQVLGTPVPKMLYGFSNNFSYGNWDMSISMYGSIGNKIFNNLGMIMSRELVGSTTQGNFISWYVNPKEAINPSRTFSDRFLEDGSFLRIANVSLGYNITIKNNNYFKKIRVFVGGNNLYVFTKYKGFDPEVNTNINTASSTNTVPSVGIDYSSYPKSRSFNGGINVTF